MLLLNVVIQVHNRDCRIRNLRFISHEQLLADMGIARLTLMVGHTFYNTTYLLLYLMACWFIRAFIYGCFKKYKAQVAITKLRNVKA